MSYQNNVVSMKIKDILEAPIAVGNLRQLGDRASKEKLNIKTKHVANIDEYQVKLSENDPADYSLWDNNDLVAMFKVDFSKDFTSVDGIWVKKEYEGKKLLSKFLWYLKSRLKSHKILLGDFHSQDTVNLLKAGGLSRFNKSWENHKTGEKVDFDKNNMDKFYSSVDWKLVFENTSDDFLGFPHFKSNNWIKDAYDWQIE